MTKRLLQLGDRVRINGDWEWPDGATGIVEKPDPVMVELCSNEWQGIRRVSKARTQTIITYFIKFDEPQDDGSGDGPYAGGEIDEANLELINDR